MSPEEEKVTKRKIDPPIPEEPVHVKYKTHPMSKEWHDSIDAIWRMERRRSFWNGIFFIGLILLVIFLITHYV